MTGSTLWYLSRATGVVSLVLFTFVAVLGIAVATKRRVPGSPRFVLRGVHRNASLLAVVFLGVHIGTAVLDSYVPLNLSDVFVPFTAAYQPLWVGLGACALDIMIAILVTTALRQRIGVRTWKVVHLLAYAAFPLVVLHGLRTGTDLRTGTLLATTLVCVAAMAGGIVWRLNHLAGQTPRAERVGEVMAQAHTELPPKQRTLHTTTHGRGRR